MGLFAERAATRKQTRQTYRTMSRMQRRHSAIQGRLGMREDFANEEPTQVERLAAAGPEYMAELDRSPSSVTRVSSSRRSLRPRRGRFSGSELSSC
jgi:hypothetical protein